MSRGMQQKTSPKPNPSQNPSPAHTNHPVGTEPVPGSPSKLGSSTEQLPILRLPRPWDAESSSQEEARRIPFLRMDTKGHLDATPKPWLSPTPTGASFLQLPHFPKRGDSHPKSPRYPPSGPAPRDFERNGNKDVSEKLELFLSHVLLFCHVPPSCAADPKALPELPRAGRAPLRLPRWAQPLCVPLTAAAHPDKPRAPQGPAGNRWRRAGNKEPRESRNKAEIHVRKEPWAEQGRVRAKEEFQEGGLTHSRSWCEAFSSSWLEQREGIPDPQGSAANPGQPRAGMLQIGRDSGKHG